MDKSYTLKSVRQLGDPDPKYGTTFWAETHDQLEPVMFNLVGGSVQDGSRITAETVELKTSAKGTTYHRLKKVKVIGGSPQPNQPPTQPPPAAQAPSDTGKMLQLIYDNSSETLKLVRQLAGTTQPSLSDAWRQTTGTKAEEFDTVVEDIGEEPMNINDIPF